MGLHQTKKLLHSKKQTNKTKQKTHTQTINKMKREPTEWASTFANYTCDKGLISKIYKELMQLNTKKTNNPMKNWAKDLNRHFSKEIFIDCQKTYEKMLNITNHQRDTNKTTMRYHLTSARMSTINKSTINRCWQKCGEKGTLMHCWQKCNHYGKQYGVSSKN
uniref:Uncharacterized protein n=1 Tax=Myotis myotis TaxID=51298 RepID=A0A7J8AMM7_MYOMY|nr:hypothetical protein mMyoMyo1_008013 [Myotis myotis]